MARLKSARLLLIVQLLLDEAQVAEGGGDVGVVGPVGRLLDGQGAFLGGAGGGQLTQLLLDDAQVTALNNELHEMVEKAHLEADAAPFPTSDDIRKDVYAQPFEPYLAR